MAVNPGPWKFTTAAIKNLINGTHDIDSDSWKVALVTSTSNIGAASTTFAGLTGELATANGYTAGGISVTLSIAVTTVGTTTTTTVTFVSDPKWTAATGNLVAREAVCYEVGGQVLMHCLLDTDGGVGIDVTAAPGEFIEVDSDGTPRPFFAITTETT